MKKIFHTFFVCIPLLTAHTLCGQNAAPSDFLPDAPPQNDRSTSIKYALILPDDKTAVTVKTGERNPFGKNDNELNQNANKGTSQENMLREHLSKLHVSGFSPGPNGIRVMLGDMALEEGQTVPVIIPDQTLNLKVSKITRNAITLVWVEKKNTTLPPRLLTLPIEIQPTVRYVLHGQVPSEKNAGKGKAKVVDKSLAMGLQALPAFVESTPDPEQPKNALPDKDETLITTGGTPPTPKQSTSTPPDTKAVQPGEWDRALWMMKNLAKLEEAQN